jgi:hypothetical protein
MTNIRLCIIVCEYLYIYSKLFSFCTVFFYGSMKLNLIYSFNVINRLIITLLMNDTPFFYFYNR